MYGLNAKVSLQQLVSQFITYQGAGTPQWHTRLTASWYGKLPVCKQLQACFFLSQSCRLSIDAV